MVEYYLCSNNIWGFKFGLVFRANKLHINSSNNTSKVSLSTKLTYQYSIDKFVILKLPFKFCL